MRKYRWMLGVLCGSLVLASGCGSEEVPEAETVVETQGESVEAEVTEEVTETEEVQESEESEEIPEEVMITVYAPDSMAEGFENREVLVKGVTAEAVLAAVIGEIGFPESVQVEGFEQDQGILNLDLNQTFLDFLRANSGSSAEYFYIGSVVNTFLEAFDGEEIMITVEGEIMETGHTDYPSAMGRFEQ